MSIRIPRGQFDLKDRTIDLMVRIEIAVVRQLLAPGSFVATAELAVEFDADPEELSSALATLHRGGLVERVGEGVRVPGLVHSDVAGLLDERFELEARIIAEAVPKLGAAERDRMLVFMRYAHMAAVVGDLEIMVKHDTAIDAILSAGFSDPGAALRARVVKSLIRRIWADMQPFADLVPLLELRRRAVEAITQGDVELSLSRLQEGIAAIRQLLVPSSS